MTLPVVPSGSGQTAVATVTTDAPVTEGGKKKRRGKSYGQVAKRGVAWSFFREGVSELIATPTALVMARLLTPFDFGVAASATFFMTFAARLTNFGFNQALIRIKVLRPEHCSAVFVASLLLGVAAYTALAGSAGLIATFFREPRIADMLRIAALTFLIIPFGTVPAALMSRNMQFRRTATADWTSSLVEAMSTIAMAYVGYGYWSIVYGRLAGTVVGTGVKLTLGRWRPGVRFARKDLDDLLSFATGIFAKRLLDYTAKNVDNLVVGRVFGLTALGFYDKAFVTVSKLLVRINTGGPIVSFRVFSIIHEEAERFRKAYCSVLLGASLVTYPAMLGLAALGPDLIYVMYGQRWMPAVVPFQILCLAGILKVQNEYAGSAVQATGRIWGQVWRQVIYAGLIVVGVAGCSFWGLPGAAFGVLAATFVMYLLMQGMLMRTTALSWRAILAAQIPGVLCGVVVAGGIVAAQWGVTSAAPSAAPWHRLTAAALAGGLCGLAFLRFNPFSNVRKLVRDLAEDLSPTAGRLVRQFV